MVGVAQLVEHQIVALGVVGSNPTTHPILFKRLFFNVFLPSLIAVLTTFSFYAAVKQNACR